MTRHKERKKMKITRFIENDNGKKIIHASYTKAEIVAIKKKIAEQKAKLEELKNQETKQQEESDKTPCKAAKTAKRTTKKGKTKNAK